MIPPPKYEKKSVAYIDKTEIMSSHLVDIPDIRQKVCKFYRINPLLIRSIPNQTEDMKVYIHSNEWAVLSSTSFQPSKNFFLFQLKLLNEGAKATE